MTSRYQQLKMEFGGEEAAADSLREALKYARRAVEHGSKITHPDVLMLLNLYEMEIGHEAAEAPSDREALKQRIGQLEEELKNRTNALVKRFNQVTVLQTDLEKAGKRIEELSRALRDREQHRQEAEGQVDLLVAWRRSGVQGEEVTSSAGSSVVEAFSSVVVGSIPFFAAKNKQYGNAIESTGVRGSVVALTGDVARLRVMLQEPELDMANLRDKLQDVLVQAGIGIVLLDAGNVDGKGA